MQNPLLGYSRGGELPVLRGRRELQGWPGSTRDRHVHARQALCFGSSSEGWGRATPHWRTLSGVSIPEHGRPRAWAWKKIFGFCMDKDTFPNHREGVTSVVQGPSRARLRLCVAGRGSPFCTAMLPWEGLGPATLSQARCLHTLRGSGLFRRAGLERGAPGLQTVQQPHPSSWEPDWNQSLKGSADRVGQGRVEPVHILVPVLHPQPL